MKCQVIVEAVFCTTIVSVVGGAPSTSSELPSSWSQVRQRGGVKPDGYLLGILGTAFYKLEFDGNVSYLWTYPLGNQTLDDDNIFTVDVKNELVYLGGLDQFIALDLNTGEVKVQFPLTPSDILVFWSFDYVAKDNAIYGVCPNDEGKWFWCSVQLHKLHQQKVKFEYLFELLSNDEAFNQWSDLYYMDKGSIWYYLNIKNIYGTNTTTGKVMFQGNDTLYYSDEQTFTSAYCIAYDSSLNRIFALHWDYLVKYPLLGELHPRPQNVTSLMKLPSSLRPVNLGSCAYYPNTHTMIAFMANVTTFLTDSMSYYILLIDVVGLTYETVPLPGLRELTNTDWIITAIKFVPNKK